MAEDLHQRGLRKLEEIAGGRRRNALNDWSEIAPDMARYIVDFVAGDVLSRPGLDSKTRQLITVVSLATQGNVADELRMHLHGALNLGWSAAELSDAFVQLAAFAGFPISLQALSHLKHVLSERNSTEVDAASRHSGATGPTAEQVLLVVVDPSVGPLSTVGSIEQAALIRNLAGLLEAASVMKIPALLAEAPLPPAAATLPPELVPWLRNAERAVHSTNDALQSDAVLQAVKKSGRRVLAFAGIATDVGVGLSALSARKMGFQTYVLADACGTISEKAEQAALVRMAAAGIATTSWVGFVGEVQGDYTRAPGPEVRAIIGRTMKLGGPFSTGG